MKCWFTPYYFSGQHLQIISKGVFSLSGLRPAIKVADELTLCFTRLKGIPQVFTWGLWRTGLPLWQCPYKAPPHLRHTPWWSPSPVVWPLFESASCLVCGHEYPSARTENKSCWGGISTLQLTDFWLLHLSKFSCSCVEANFFWLAFWNQPWW